MLKKTAFKKMLDYLKQEDEKREAILESSREVIRQSKKAIYAMHRGDKKEYMSEVEKLKKSFVVMKKMIVCNADAANGQFHVAEQEYVEAMLYQEFILGKEFSSAEELSVSVENYLLGLCDLTGELSRKATASCIAKDFKTVLSVKKAIEEIYGFFLETNLRNSELRKKSDSVKWNLKSVEDIVYDLTTKGLL